MALNLPVFYKRTASAIVFAAVMLTGLLWNDWAFLALVALIEFLCLREYFKLIRKINPDNLCPRWLSWAMHISGLLLLALFSLNNTPAATVIDIVFPFLP